ncbi:MAG: hypothetical protein KF832_05490 [Caldilineaceae bacterium]|nr:hypothetical protein [Caldilineaceae bacterium]
MKKYINQSGPWLLGLGSALVLVLLLGLGRLQANGLAVSVAPSLINYQGHLRDINGDPFTGQAALRFTIYDAEVGGNNLWSETYQNLPINAGNFSVNLGTSTPLTATVFSSALRYLQLSVDLTNSNSNYTDFPRQRLTAVPYAFQADSVPWSGITGMPVGFADGIDDGGSAAYENVVIVAKSGGHFTTITEAMNSINPSSSSRYLVWVAPGLYEEQVTVKTYVHLRGAGANTTQIRSTASGSHNNTASATLILPANSQISQLSVENAATSQDGVAIYVNNGNSATSIQHVTAKVMGSGGDRHDGIYFNSGTATLEHVYVEVSGGNVGNWAIFTNAASPVIDSATLLATGNGSANALRLNGGNPVVQNSTLRATQSPAAYAIEGTGGGNHTVRIDHSVVDGEDFGIRLSAGNYTLYVGASMVNGGGNAFSGLIRCVASYKADYTATNATCN